MFSQRFSRSTAIRRNSFGYRPFRLFATCSFLSLQSVPYPIVSSEGFSPHTNSSCLCSTTRSRQRYKRFFSATAKSVPSSASMAVLRYHWRCTRNSLPGSSNRFTTRSCSTFSDLQAVFLGHGEVRSQQRIHGRAQIPLAMHAKLAAWIQQPVHHQKLQHFFRSTSGFSRPRRSPFPAAHPWPCSDTTGDARETRCLDPATGSPPEAAALFPMPLPPEIRPDAYPKTHRAPVGATTRTLTSNYRTDADVAVRVRSVSLADYRRHRPESRGRRETNSSWNILAALHSNTDSVLRQAACCSSLISPR